MVLACFQAGPSSTLGSAPHGGFFPIEHTSNEEKRERGLIEWRSINVCKNVIINECIEKDNNKKMRSVATATEPINL